MKSPELDPELDESLLESLANWDPRASVPLALDYMRLGDEAGERQPGAGHAPPGDCNQPARPGLSSNFGDRQCA